MHDTMYENSIPTESKSIDEFKDFSKPIKENLTDLLLFDEPIKDPKFISDLINDGHNTLLGSENDESIKFSELKDTYERESQRHNSANAVISDTLYSPRRNEEDGVYYSVLEVMLNRPFSATSILDDSDFIQNKYGLFLLQETVMKGSLEMKHRAVQDLLMLTK